jgi:molecular chaperone DnaK (HSP70)
VTPTRPLGEKSPVPNAVIGVDLGTSNSAVGIIDGGEARIVRTNDGATTCSRVAFTEVFRSSTRPTFTYLEILPTEVED